MSLWRSKRRLTFGLRDRSSSRGKIGGGLLKRRCLVLDCRNIGGRRAGMILGGIGLKPAQTKAQDSSLPPTNYQS